MISQDNSSDSYWYYLDGGRDGWTIVWYAETHLCPSAHITHLEQKSTLRPKFRFYRNLLWENIQFSCFLWRFVFFYVSLPLMSYFRNVGWRPSMSARRPGKKLNCIKTPMRSLSVTAPTPRVGIRSKVLFRMSRKLQLLSKNMASLWRWKKIWRSRNLKMFLRSLLQRGETKTTVFYFITPDTVTRKNSQTAMTSVISSWWMHHHQKMTASITARAWTWNRSLYRRSGFNHGMCCSYLTVVFLAPFWMLIAIRASLKPSRIVSNSQYANSLPREVQMRECRIKVCLSRRFWTLLKAGRANLNPMIILRVRSWGSTWNIRCRNTTKRNILNTAKLTIRT